MSKKPKCKGPVDIGDQGIEYCEACRGCTCCDADNMDHSDADYRCWLDRDGKCLMKDNKHFPMHDCERMAR